MQEGNGERAGGRQRGRLDEIDLGQLLERRLGQNAEEQRRQRDVEDEEVHPGEALVGHFLSLPQAKPMKIRPKNGRARLMMSSMGEAVTVPDPFVEAGGRDHRWLRAASSFPRSGGEQRESGRAIDGCPRIWIPAQRFAWRE